MEESWNLLYCKDFSFFVAEKRWTRWRKDCFVCAFQVYEIKRRKKGKKKEERRKEEGRGCL
ncbi:MAG: hypothetical protein ACLTUP_08605 [Anaerotignum sp.]|uniref:hypothetical protein n=1 Tax=Anaerotignum sp. TaxID=2039241 RepID=UPI0039960A8E